jgi:16S rRNA (guanine527-N7)-methyltransferase
MTDLPLIRKYFTDLTDKQYEQLTMLEPLYTEWNQKINVISRRDIGHLYEHHVLHSMAIAKLVQFVPGTKVMDLGTGGGFPGVPLAILFPESRFHLVDSIGKKLTVIDAVTEAIGLTNVFTFHSRAEQMEFRYDFVVSRAVAPLSSLMGWTKNKYAPRHHNTRPNGLICLKGGDLTDEIKGSKIPEVIPVSTYFDEPFYADKSLVYVKR